MVSGNVAGLKHEVRQDGVEVSEVGHCEHCLVFSWRRCYTTQFFLVHFLADTNTFTVDARTYDSVVLFHHRFFLIPSILVL